MTSKITKLYFQNKTLWLVAGGLACIVLALLATQYHFLPHLLIELLSHVGGLLAVVGVLHWLFEHGMREEMFHDISRTVLANERIRQSGLRDCYTDSSMIDKSPEEQAHWKKADKLIIGAHYAEYFFREEIGVFQVRCEKERKTTILLLKPNGIGAHYLKELDSEVPDISERVERIKKLLHDSPHLPDGKAHITILLHEPVLRYSFIATEENIWVNFFTNSKGMTPVPAIKVAANSPLYQIFMGDIERLMASSNKGTQDTFH